MEPLLEKGYHLYVDNWYSSITLFKYLFKYHTQACGTIRIKRRGFPRTSETEVKSVPTGAVNFFHLKFKNKRDVTMLSTIHDEEVDQGRRNAAQQKPKCISDYKYIGGVDRTYRLLQPYEIARKPIKWYKKLEIHLLQLAMLNVSCFSRKMGSKALFGISA